MANVYLARDIKHDRDVAVKVLKPELAAALGSDRFLREIRVAAQLQHPHILPLHDSGDADGYLYYVMPYVKGESLRERLENRGELPVAESLTILREVVDALSHAHEQGVVHRDIKPDNIMVSGRHALVMDFGVAKAVSEATGQQHLTTAGFALGTPAYMAPEQATADPNTDHRADIYAVGVVAYELLTGKTPFGGASPQMILAAHVTQQAEPVSKHREKVSPALEAVVMRCLEKNPADRWQTAEEMLPQLDALATSSGGLTPTSTVPLSAVSISGKKSRIGIALAAIVLVALIAFALIGPNELEITVVREFPVTTGRGMEFEPSISPDGSRVVFSRGGQYQTNIYWKLVDDGGGAEIPVGLDLAGYHRFPTWDNSGNVIRFGARTDLTINTRELEYHTVPMSGGTATPLNVNGDPGDVVWSPIDDRVAFVDSDQNIVVRDGSGNERILVESKEAGSFDGNWWPQELAWSPDGRRIAFSEAPLRLDGGIVMAAAFPSAMRVVDVEGGGADFRVTDGNSSNLSPVWLPDSRHLVYISNQGGSRGVHVLEIGEAGAVGEPRRLAGGNDAHTLSISTDGKRIAFGRLQFRSSIRAFDVAQREQLRISDGRTVADFSEHVESLQISPDGEWIAFGTRVTNNSDVYLMKSDGTGRRQLTSGPEDDYVRFWSPDQSQLSVHRHYQGVYTLVVESIDGSGTVDSFPDYAWNGVWSPDGLTIGMNGQDRAGTWPGLHLARRSAVGEDWGEPTFFAEDCSQSDRSPDGSGIVCWVRDMRLFAEDGELVREWPANPIIENGWAIPVFSPDGSLIYQVLVDQAGRQSIWATPVSGADPFPVVVNDDESLFFYLQGIDVGPDGTIYVIVAEWESDIWVMELEF